MICTSAGSRYSVRLRIETDRGKVSENLKESSPSKRPDILHKEESGSKVASEAESLSPESGALTRQTVTRAGERDVLAGEPGRDCVDPVDSIVSKPGRSKEADVVIAWDSGPMLREHSPAPGVKLAECDGFEARAVQAQ